MSRASRAGIASAIQNATPVARSVEGRVNLKQPPDERDGLLTVEASEPLDLRDWALQNQSRIQEWLRVYGAVLFRGFEIESSERFGEVSDVMTGGRITYMNRSSPRTTVGDRIYTSTDYPHHLPIFPHNEHGYSPVFPLYVFFCCFQPAESGGATPIGATRRITASVPATIRAHFLEKKILYIRNYHEGFGVPWQEAFQTSDKTEVESHCASRGVTCEWRDHDVLRTRRIGPAEVTHPYTGEAIWFNHATFYHVSTLPEAIRDEMLANFDEDDLPNNTYYGDGSPIEPDVLATLRSTYLTQMSRFDWRKGDLLALDNILSVHARDPFTGYRRVVVSMAEEVRVY